MEKNRKRRDAFKRNLIAVAVASCFAGDLAVANPTGPTVVAGQASFQQAGNLLSITNSPSTIINWRGFSIGASEITRFLQQSAASAVLNRVTGGDLSTILGALQSNGRVFLVNPTGIVIGSGARIDVAGFVASTLNLPDADFLAGRMRFIETPNAGSIVNQGAINAASGGNVYLVAPEITNSGIITSPRGEVILAAGKSVELVNPGTPNLRVEIAAPDNQAINLGQIVADSGRAGIYAGIISNRGVIRADTIATGENGEILLRATKNITLEPGSVISASGAPGGVHDGGTVRIVADDTLDMQRGSAVHVDGGVDGGNGGFLELSGHRVIRPDGEFSVRALVAGYQRGTLYFDPADTDITSNTLDPACGVTITCLDPALAFGGLDNVVDTTNNLRVLSPITNSNVNGGAAGGSLTLNAGNNLTASAPIGTSGTRFDHDLSLNAGNDVIVNNNIYLGNRTLTLAANVTALDGSNTTVGNVIITPTTAPVTVDTQGSIKVSGVDFNVLGGNNKAVTVTAGGDLIVGNHPDLGGGRPELTGRMLVQGGNAGNDGNASATVHANGNIFIKAGSVEIRGGTATANASDNSFNTATANAEVSAGNNLKLKTTSGGLTVAGGSATARASYSGSTNNSATANANATLAATNSMTLEVAGGVLVQGGDSAQAYASYLGPNIATANANASITAGTTLTLSATSLEVRGGDFARASASSGGPNTATANANATLSSGGDMILMVGTGGMTVRGGDNAFASASSGTTGLNTAQINANALVSSGGLLTLTVTGGGLTVRGGDNAIASNSSGDGLTTALVNVKASMLANAMDLTVTGPVLIRGGNSARASASCCQGSSAQNTATTTADALIRATNNLTLTVNGSNSLMVAGGDNARASGSEFSGQSRNMTVNTNAELSAGGNLTVIMNNQGPVTVRGGDSAVAKTSASSSGRSMVSTVNARGKMAAGGLVEIKGPAGLVTVRGGDNARASASGSSIAVTSATANVEGQITGASVKITASDLTVRGGNNASASAYDNVGNTATITANGLLNATSALDLIISGAMNVAGGNAARAMARSAGSGNTNQAATSAGALVTGGNITISAGSLAISGGVQGSSDRATFSGSGANRATTLANANIVATGNLTYTGGPVTLQGGTARTQGSGGSMNSATAEASAGIQVAGTKTLNITGDLQILGGQALDTVVAPNTGSATARAVLDPGALDATASGNVVLSDGTVTGAGSAYSAVIGGGVTLQADDMSIGGTINAGGGTVILRPNSTTRDINIESGATSGVLSLNPSELQKITAGTLEIGRTTDTGTLSVNTALGTADVNATVLKLQHQNIAVNSDIGSTVTPFQHDLALFAGNGVSVNNSIVLHSGGSLALVAATGDLNILSSSAPTRVESLDMALLAGGNVNVGSASGTQSTTVLANRLLAVGAASNFTVRGGAAMGAFTSVGGGGLTVIATGGDVIVAGGGGSNASATVSGTPDVDLLVGGVVRLDAGTGSGASAAISAGSATSIRLDLPDLESGGFFVNGQEGVVYDAATATGFFAGGAPAVLGQSLLVTYGVTPPPTTTTVGQNVQQAINTTVQSTTEASRTGEDSGTLGGERTASQGAGPTEKEKEKEKEEKARPVCN